MNPPFLDGPPDGPSTDIEHARDAVVLLKGWISRYCAAKYKDEHLRDADIKTKAIERLIAKANDPL